MTFIFFETIYLDDSIIWQSQLDDFDLHEDAKNLVLLTKVAMTNNGQVKSYKNPKLSKCPTFTWTIHCYS